MSDKSLVRENAERDPSYRPYCLRCRTMERMEKKSDLYWRCQHCGAEHEEPPMPADFLSSVRDMPEVQGLDLEIGRWAAHGKVADGGMDSMKAADQVWALQEAQAAALVRATLRKAAQRTQEKDADAVVDPSYNEGWNDAIAFLRQLAQEVKP